MRRLYPRHALLHPARYHRGLLERVRSASAAVVPHCAVTGVQRERDGFRLQTAGGVLQARDVVVATNGYTGAVTPWLRRRVIPIGSYLIATEPLAPGLMDRLMPASRAVSDTRRVVYYYRASPDRTRIVFGGRVSLAETDPRISGQRLLGAAGAGTAFDGLPFPTRPLYDGRPWFLAGSVAWFRWLDRLPL